MRTTRLALLLLLALLCAGCTTRSQRLYLRAETFFAQGKYELAAADYNTLLRVYPRDPLADNALYKLAYLYREEFDDPATAVSLYQRLVREYPTSPSVGDALWWTVYLQARQLRNPAAVLATCGQIDRLCADQPRLRASARLELARAYLEAGQTPQAIAALQEICTQFSGEADTCAEAGYRLALITRDQLGQGPQALKMLEEVISKYPDTAAAAQARQALGWQYYTQKNQEDQQRLAELQRLARTLTGVPTWPAASAPSLELLGALRALMAQAGASVSEDDLLAVTGLAFQMAVDWGNPEKTLFFHRDPFPQVAEAWGFGYNSWTFGSAPEALPALVESLSRNRPVLLLFGASNPRWRLFTGYQPQQKLMFLLGPGQGKPQPLAEADFAAGWPQRGGRALFSPLPPEGLQFALTERGPAPSRVDRTSGAVLRAALALDETQLLGAPAGRAAYDALAQKLAAAARDPREGQKLVRWALQALPLLVRARQAAAASLGAAAEDFPEPQRTRVTQAAAAYTGFAQRWQALLSAIQTAAASTNPEVWNPARTQYDTLAADEQNTLAALAAAMRS
jgi:TolA-binding protein